jgi:hypothetical protein
LIILNEKEWCGHGLVISLDRHMLLQRLQVSTLRGVKTIASGSQQHRSGLDPTQQPFDLM